jgi:hypothetical protein
LGEIAWGCVACSIQPTRQIYHCVWVTVTSFGRIRGTV